MKLSIIVPFYNEEHNVENVLDEIKTALKDYDYEIIAINDGSYDNTSSILQKYANRGEIVLLEFTRNFGQSAAFQAGFDNASGDILITIDGDMQNDPNDIPKMIEKMQKENADLVVGWRYKRKDKLFFRIIPSIIANKLLASFLNLPIHDTGCSLKLIKRDIIDDIKLYGEMHRFIPYLASAKGAHICEIKVSHRKRKSGKTKYGLSRIFKVLLDMLTVKFLNDYSTNPIYAIGGISLISFLLSFVSFVLMLLMKIFYGVDITGNPLFLIGIFLSIMGLQILMIGLISEIQIRIYYETREKSIYKIKRIINVKK